MNNLIITENDYQKVNEIVKKYEKIYYESYITNRDKDYITLMGAEISYQLLKEIEEKTNISGWAIHPTIEAFDGIKDGVKIYLYRHKK